MPDSLLKFSSLFCSAAEGLLSSRKEAAEILGVNSNASIDEINSAYKKKVKYVHPDLNPGIDPIKIKLLNAAKDLMLSSPVESFQDISSDEEIDLDMSYEEVAEMRNEMGRSEFNKKFPGWENELKREIGLDKWNLIFEKYDSVENDERSESESSYEQLINSAKDNAYNLLFQSRDDGKLELHSTFEDLVNIYPNLIKIPKYVEKRGLEKKYQQELKLAFEDLFFKDFINDVRITIQDVLDFPNEDVIKSFLIQNYKGNLELPDVLLSNESFGKTLILMLKTDDDEVAEKIIKRYAQNNALLSGLVKSASYMHFLIGNEKATSLLISLPFNNDEARLIKRRLKI